MIPDDHFEVSFFINHLDQTWESTFRDVFVEKKIGSIDGEIQHERGKKVFYVNQSDLEGDCQGKGLGYLMYLLTIKRALQFCSEVRSSPQLNDYSRGVWKSLAKKFHNIEKKGDIYIVKKVDVLKEN